MMTTATDTSKKAAPAAPKKPANEGFDWLSWALLAPTIVLFLLFEFFPFFRALYLSFASTDLFGRPRGFAGLTNYAEMVSDPTFLATLSRTLIFTIVTVALKIIIGLAIALPLSYRLRGTFWMRSLVLVPMAVSTAIGTLVFRNMFAPTVGLFDQLFASLGLPQVGWLTSPNVALFSTIIVDLWIGISFVILLLMVAVDNISTEVVEAANLDGATGLRYIRHIVIPGIAPMLMVLIVTQSISAMKEFTIFNVLTNGGPGHSTRTLVLDIYDKAFGGGTADFAGASARGMVLFIIVLVLTLIQFRLSSRTR